MRGQRRDDGPLRLGFWSFHGTGAPCKNRHMDKGICVLKKRHPQVECHTPPQAVPVNTRENVICPDRQTDKPELLIALWKCLSGMFCGLMQSADLFPQPVLCSSIPAPMSALNGKAGPCVPLHRHEQGPESLGNQLAGRERAQCRFPAKSFSGDNGTMRPDAPALQAPD